MVKAVVMIEPGKIELQDFPYPKIAPDSLLLRVDLVGICGSDSHMYRGHSHVAFPVIPGHELTGTIAELGSEANNTMRVVGGLLQEGDRVVVVPSSKSCGRCFFCLQMPHRPNLCPNRTVHGFRNCQAPPHLFGGYAEYLYVDGNSWVYKLDEALSPELAVFADPVSTALRAVEKALPPGLPNLGEGYGVGKRVVVIGVGPIGLLTVAILRDTGAGTIIATDVSDSRLEMARTMGADLTLNVHTTSPQERKEAVLSVTEGVGADVVLECAGVPEAFAEGLELVRRGGKLVEVGHYTDPGAVTIRPFQICNKDLDIHGCWAYPQIEFKEALLFLRRTRAPLTSLISHRLPLNEAERGLQMLGTDGVLKVVIAP
jgi:L-iditol 2-dehydrogenase